MGFAEAREERAAASPPDQRFPNTISPRLRELGTGMSNRRAKSSAPKNSFRKLHQRDHAHTAYGPKDFTFVFSEVVFILCRPASCRGTYARRHERRGGMRWCVGLQRDLFAPTNFPTRTVKSCGPGLPVLRSCATRQGALSQTGAIKPVPEESAYKPSNTARGMPDDPAEPVVTAACISFRTRAMGEAFTRHSLRPLVWRATALNSSGASCRESAKSCLARLSVTRSVSFRGVRSTSPESILTGRCVDICWSTRVRNTSVRGYGFRARPMGAPE
jgi:hypothetical protein